jgi:hypothetical protein
MTDAAIEQHAVQNRFDLGGCIAEMQRCMAQPNVCGADFAQCTFYNVGEGLGAASNDRTPTRVGNSTVQVARATLLSLEQRRIMCFDTVTNQCIAVRDQVWPAFLDIIGPTLRSAELIAENNQRQNRVRDIADCFRNSCIAQFDPENNPGGFNSCISDPRLMADNCRVILLQAGVAGVSTNINQPINFTAMQSDPLWTMITALLGAMRIDACTQEIRTLLEHPNNCGENFAACVGGNGALDIIEIRRFIQRENFAGVPSCRVNGHIPADFNDRLDDMAMGIFLQIDNAAMDICIAAIDSALNEVCFDDPVCAAPFEDVIGNNFLSLDTTRPGEVRLEGLIEFNWFMVNNPITVDSITARPTAGQQASGFPSVGIRDADVLTPPLTIVTGNAKGRSETNAIRVAEGINMVLINFLGRPDVQGCVIGRDLSQATGVSAADRANARGRDEPQGRVTQARFPRLADASVNMLIRMGLNTVEDSYLDHLEQRQRDAIKAIMEKRESPDALVDDGTVCWIPTARGSTL